MLVERRGSRETRRPLSGLRWLRLTGSPRRSALLAFPRGFVLIPSRSWLGPGRMEDRTDAFGTFVRGLAAETAEANPKARFLSGAAQLRSGLVWAMLLLGAGAAMLLLFSVSADFAGFGIALAARLVFVLLLIAAVLPWVERRAGTFDPKDIPANLL